MLLGVLLVVFGRFLSHYYLRLMRTSKESKPQNTLKTKGLFKYSRNPGLLALYISFLGFFFIMPSVVFLLCFITYVTHMHFKIKLEEEFLKLTFKDTYPLYMKKVRRYL